MAIMISLRCGVVKARARCLIQTALCCPRMQTIVTSSEARTPLLVQKKSPLQRIWDAYSESVHEHPIFTKAVMAAAIFFVSDTASQYIQSRHKDSFDWSLSRALSGSTFGIVATVGVHYWWGLLETVVKKRLPLKTHRLANTATKVFLDQTLKAPAYIFSYFVLTRFLNEQMDGTKDWRASWSEANSKAGEMLLPTMLQHWRVWIPVHSFNFYFVPLHHRVLVQNTILVFWSGYLSYLNHQQDKMITGEENTAERHETSLPSNEKCNL